MINFPDPLVLDGFFSHNRFIKLRDYLLSGDQPWYLNQNISISDEGDSRLYYGFSCWVVRDFDNDNYEDNYAADLIYPFNEKLKYELGMNDVIRCRLDMTTYRKDSILFGPHIDLDVPHYTSILYITDSDSPTIIYNERLDSGDVPKDMELTINHEIFPKENRLVLFDGNQIHTGKSPTSSSCRILVNTNFLKEEKSVN